MTGNHAHRDAWYRHHRAPCACLVCTADRLVTGVAWLVAATLAVAGTWAVLVALFTSGVGR